MADLNNYSNQSMTYSSYIHKSKQDSKYHYAVKVKRTESTDLSPWKEIKTPSTQVNCRYHHSSVLHQGKLYVHGGLDNDVGVLSDFKMFDNAEQSKSKWTDLPTENGPGPRHSHSATIHNETIYIFGGKVDRFNSTNSLHAFSLKQKKWKIIETHADPDLQNGVPQEKIKKQQVFQKQNLINSLKKQPKKQTPIKPSNKPGPIDSHQAVIIGDEMIVYGGFSNNEFVNTIYSLNLNTKVWKKVYPSSKIDTSRQQGQNKTQSVKIEKNQQPEPRSDFSMVVYKQKLYIYAGKNLNKSFSDLWSFDFTTLKFSKLCSQIDGKPFQKRSGHSAVVYKNYMLVFGGITTVTHERDDFLCYNFDTDKWAVAWNNSESLCAIKQKLKKKCTQKKMSSTKNKSPQNSSYRSKHEQQQNLQPRKYRRPIAEQKKLNLPRERCNDNELNKKQNQRKILLINQIQTQVKPWQNPAPEQYSPLIESLTNSIMITSNVHPPGASLSGRNQFNTTKTQLQNIMDKSKQKKLKARDGHTAHIMGDEMLIFGGDRHMISINDVVYINLELIMDHLQTQFKNQISEEAHNQVDKVSQEKQGSGGSSSSRSNKKSQ